MYTFDSFKNESTQYVKALWKHNLVDGETIIDCQATEETNPFLPKESSFCLRIELVSKSLSVKYKVSIVYSIVY